MYPGASACLDGSEEETFSDNDWKNGSPIFWSCCRAPAIGAGMLVAAFTSLMKTQQKIGEKSMMNLKIGDIVKAKDCELRLVVVGASDKGYNLFSVWPYNDRFLYWEVDADGHGDILSIVPDPDWDAMKVTNLQKKNRKGRYLP